MGFLLASAPALAGWTSLALAGLLCSMVMLQCSMRGSLGTSCVGTIASPDKLHISILQLVSCSSTLLPPAQCLSLRSIESYS